LAAGTLEIGTDECTVAAQSAISTTIASLANATNPKWVIVEASVATGVTTINFNQGTAAANPAFPSRTVGRVPLAFLYVPANATNVDTLLTTSNGLAKLIDCRVLRPAPARLYAVDIAQTQLTNPTAATSLLAATFTIPANSLRVGDTFEIVAGGLCKLFAASTVLISLTMPTVAYEHLTASLALDSTNQRRWTMRVTYTVAAIGSGTTGAANIAGDFSMSVPSALATPVEFEHGTAGRGLGSGFDTTLDRVIDLRATLGTGNASSFVSLRQFSIRKFPA
jgi:hypothetical protein